MTRKVIDRDVQLAPPAAVPALAPAAAPSGPLLDVEKVLALQSSAGNQAVARLLRKPGTSGVLARDQREGTGDLSSRQLSGIESEIHPGSAAASGGPARLWDGRTGQADMAARRAELLSQMTTAMEAYLNGVMPGIRQQADTTRTPRVPVATMTGAGRAAKRVVDDLFSAYASAAALTSNVEHQRTDFDFDPGTELIDRSDPAQFRTNVADLSDWIAQTAGPSAAAQRAHGFDKDRNNGVGEEATWLESAVLRPFVAAHRADLDLFDRFGFLDTTRRRISIVPTLVAGGSTAPGAGGAPSEAVRRQQWSNWQYLAHEYIHTLEHPAFEEARGGNRVLFEGFCEHFTLQALARWVPIARADTDAALRGEIEGRDGAGRLWPGFRAAWVATPDAGAYAEYVQHTRRIKALIGAGGENALRGAFFQGHVELIGLDPSGTILSAPLNLTDQVQVPAGIADRAALAVASGVSQAVIARNNPALAAAGAAVNFGMRVVLPGCREHVIAEGRPTFDVPGGPSRIETPAQIATQNGVAEADVRRANPAVNFATLRAGDHILIPNH